jgi:hypothetical protein
MHALYQARRLLIVNLHTSHVYTLITVVASVATSVTRFTQTYSKLWPAVHNQCGCRFTLTVDTPMRLRAATTLTKCTAITNISRLITHVSTMLAATNAHLDTSMRLHAAATIAKCDAITYMLEPQHTGNHHACSR